MEYPCLDAGSFPIETCREFPLKQSLIDEEGFTQDRTQAQDRVQVGVRCHIRQTPNSGVKVGLAETGRIQSG